MRVLWWGDAGCHTGFARVSHAIGDRLVTDHGHEVSALAVNYDGDYWPTPMRMYRPTKLSMTDIYGQSRIVELLGETMPDVVVILNDPHVVTKFLFGNKWDQERALLQSFPIVSYIPVDGINMPPTWEILGKVTTRVAMSKFGQAQMPGSDLVYHGIDTKLYHPVSARNPITLSNGTVITSKAEAKKAFGYPPDSYMVLRVDRNSARKDFPDTWKALVPVMRRHRDIVVHFHCVPTGDHFNLSNLITRDPETAKRIFFPGMTNTFKGWPDNDLVALYNAADLFVTTSWGEGFGLTIAEALACGVPVIAQNVSAIPEVVGPGGRLIEPERMTAVPAGQDQWLPNVAAFSEAIEDFYLNRKKRQRLGDAGRQHVVKTFDWDVQTAHMNDILRMAVDGGSKPSEQVESDSGGDPGDAVQHHDEADGGEGGG